jgi:transposase
MAIGARAMVVAVPPDRASEPVRVCETVTLELHAWVAWLVACHIDTVAMASTGSSWGPSFARLEPPGITPDLVNARQVTTGPGRTTEWNKAQGLPTLHTLGVWPASFRPDAERCLWRTRLRHRTTVSAPRAPHLLPRQQALNLLPIQLREVLTEITGGPGPAILRASVQGARDPLPRAQ